MHRLLLPLARISCVLALFAAALVNAASTLSKNVYLVPGSYPRDSQPDGNSVLLVTPKGLIVIDTGRRLAHTQSIIDFANTVHRPIVAAINTHWHLDHSGGNVLLRQLHPTLSIYATDAVRDALGGFLKSYRSQLEEAIAAAKVNADVSAWRSEIKLIDAGDQLAPTHVIKLSRELTISERKFKFHVERATTAGDLWIEDLESNTVVAGDLVTLPVPFFDTACPSEWEAALNRIAKTPFKMLIPGHGAPMDRNQFAAYLSAFSRLLACANSDRPSSQCVAEWTDHAKDLIEPDDADRVGPMLDYYFKSLLRASPNVRTRYCSH